MSWYSLYTLDTLTCQTLWIIFDAFKRKLAKTRASQIKTKTKGTANLMVTLNVNGQKFVSAVVKYRLYKLKDLIERLHTYRLTKLSKNKYKGRMQAVNQ